MRYQRNQRSSSRQTFGVLLRLAFLCAGAAFMTLRATAQKPEQPPPAAEAATEDDAATIKDDPTIAPDAKQSADNNVSFPVDI